MRKIARQRQQQHSANRHHIIPINLPKVAEIAEVFFAKHAILNCELIIEFFRAPYSVMQYATQLKGLTLIYNYIILSANGSLLLL